MNIAIDTSPLITGHKVRGVGFYLQHLLDAMKKYFPQHNYLSFSQKGHIPHEAQIVHYPYFEPFFLTLPLRNRLPTVVTIHDLIPLIFPEKFPAGIKGQIRFRIQKYALKHVSAIITDSENSKKDIHKILRIPNEKIYVVSLAPGEMFTTIKENKRYKTIQEKYGLPQKFALYTGDATWNKNLPRLIRAIEKTNIPLIMVGKALKEKGDENNAWNNDLIETQKMIGKSKQILCLGFIPTEDLVTLYNMATVFVMPSLYEGFGLPVLEAMACGCPVVTTKEGSLLEVGGDSVFYVDGYTSDSIAQGIQTVFKDEKLQKKLRELGLIRAKLFSWEKSAFKTLQVYSSVL